MIAPFRTVALLIALGVPVPAETIPVSRTAQLDGAKIHFTEYGTGDTALLFVPGWACDETFWAAQAPAMAAKHHVITIDLPGHGQSENVPSAHSMDLYARAIDVVLGEAGVKSVTLIGHSNGTLVIRQAYRKFPEKIRALVIVDGGLRPLADKAAIEPFIARLKGPDYEKNAGQMIDGMTASIKDAALRERIRTTILRTPQAVAMSEFESTLDDRLWAPDKILVPVLMVMAKQPLWTAEYEQFVRGLVPNLEYQVWEGVSHFLMMEQPERFNAALSAFLEMHKL